MDIFVTGGAWVTALGYGRLSEGGLPVFSPGPLITPPASEIFSQPHSRYGRFDAYTRAGCAAVALTLRDAGFQRAGGTEAAGMVVSTACEVMDTDAAYYATTLQEGGALSSPNLFSYTLPVIVLGECAVLFNLTGPTFCVGEGGGLGIRALESAASMIRSGKAGAMIAGWIDCLPDGCAGATGAIFVMLEAKPGGAVQRHRKITYVNGGLVMGNGRDAESILDFFDKEDEK